MIGDDPLLAVVCVQAHRYAVEDVSDRWTLDTDVHTDTGLVLATGVLEFKSADPGAMVPAAMQLINLRPMRINKFLWATGWGR